VEGTGNTKRTSSRENLGEVLCSKVKQTYYCRGYLHLIVSMENFIEEERRMTMDGQVKGSKGIHDRVKEYIDSMARKVEIEGILCVNKNK